MSQDLLYIILSSYISKKFELVQEYVDFVDENNVRTRYEKIRQKFKSLTKTVQSINKFVYVDNDTLVPFVERVSVEEDIETTKIDFCIKRLLTCQVFSHRDYPTMEIKFEKIYLDKNIGDKFDSLMASKQILLLNLLRNRNDCQSKQSHLGSDEILANIRLEYEYDNDYDESVLRFMASTIRDMDAISHYQNINPFLPYTTLFNNIIYRKFEDEKLIYDTDLVNDIFKWAPKLDGVRGKGIFTRNHVVIFMDDMQMFSGTFPSIFSVNNVVAFQCELLIDENTIYITDLLHVFKYLYNNRTQYECSLDGYDIDAMSAVKCINYLRATHSATKLTIGNYENQEYAIKFQSFFDAPIETRGYTTVATDGFVVLDINSRYIKCKYIKTMELEYNETEGIFYTLHGPIKELKIVSDIELKHEKIYEVAVSRDTIKVLKMRNDRLIPQTLNMEIE